ncbi:MAG: ligase-associated DNA damage response exonuclease [Saprospiraceae bacterium]|nr:ligase-associated DNA damage response exonuclease [Saprospiraceae bacterium]
MDLLTFTDKGLYCEAAGIYIDPKKPVDYALITHGHADHSRWGHKRYLCAQLAKPVIKHRLGPIKIQSVPYGERVTINGVHFSFHPAGHIVGSAQIRVEYKGEVWVASGDYKTTSDGISTPFEPVKCHTFITESTFGLPVFKWKSQDQVFEEINAWWAANKAAGKTSILCGYSLGKAQLLLAHVNPEIGKIYAHAAVENVNKVIRKQGIPIPECTRITPQVKKSELPGSLIIAPPSAVNSSWVKPFGEVSIGMASGWMAMRNNHYKRMADKGFTLSDHADWEGLNQAVEQSEATRVIVTHGYTAAYSQWLREKGYEAEGINLH